MKVTIENLTLCYEGNTVVRDLDLEIADGESLVLLGQSGCGKTSTMRCVAGLETPNIGRITIGDRVVHDSATGRAVPPHKRNVGMVFQSYAVWPHRTVFENVAFSLTMQKVGKDETRQRVLDTLDLVGLRELADRGASQLSGGQMQRVALARSLVMRPSVLLLDEPLSNLDARLRERLRIELRELQLGSSLTTVYVTHDQVEAFALADRIALMQNGRIVQIGTPEEIYKNPVVRLGRGLPRRRQHLLLHTRSARHDAAVGLSRHRRSRRWRGGRSRTDQRVPARGGSAGERPRRTASGRPIVERSRRCRQLPGRHHPLSGHHR